MPETSKAPIYTQGGREHYHCPKDCENPQPFRGPDGEIWCGRCWFKDGVRTVVFLCTPETCDEG